jgi:DNA-binding transcriptional MocR family regulator
MASPVTVALATRWISDGTGDALVDAVRRESAERQTLAATILRNATFRANPAGFHLWLSLPTPWSRSAFIGHMRATGIGVVASDAFTTGDTPPEAVRVCLGGPADRAQVRDALEFMAHTLAEKPSRASSFL